MRAEALQVFPLPVVNETERASDNVSTKNAATLPIGDEQNKTDVNPDERRGRFGNILELAEERKKQQERKRIEALAVYDRNSRLPKEAANKKGTQLDKAV